MISGQLLRPPDQKGEHNETEFDCFGCFVFCGNIRRDINV